MSEVQGFSWIKKPLLAAMAEPYGLEEFNWLRQQGIQIVISLTEVPPARNWINDAGLMQLHEPIEDMTPPTQEQIDQVLQWIDRANASGMGVAVHCTAGLGRTGTILACYFINQEMAARDAIDEVRRLRPGSIETDDQIAAIQEYARRQGWLSDSDVPDSEGDI